MSSARILVTGASGYIGRAFAEYAVAQGADVLALTRSKPNPPLPCPFLIPSDWTNVDLLARAMAGCGAIVHSAGLVHGKKGDMHGVNVILTRHLAEAALQAQVPHFVFISSANVFGQAGRWRLADAPCPKTPYGRSKMEAEILLHALFKNSATRLTIVRPPLVIGPDAQGHAELVRRLVARNIPLPFGSLGNQRSYVQLYDLVLFLFKAANKPPKADSLVHITTGGPLTASALIRLIAQTSLLKARLFPVPHSIIKLFALIPPFKRKLRPLVDDHVLEAGRVNLDQLV